MDHSSVLVPMLHDTDFRERRDFIFRAHEWIAFAAAR
jgi:hypothetical protein